MTESPHVNSVMRETLSKFTRGCSVFHTSMRNKQVEFNPYILYFIKIVPFWLQAKEKYRGVFETQKSGDKTSSGEIGLDIRTHASPKVGQDQVSGGVSVLCWHAAPVAYVLWKPCTIR